MQKSSFLCFCYILRAIRAALCWPHIHSDVLQNAPFRSQFFKIFFASGGKGALAPLTKILRTFLDVYTCSAACMSTVQHSRCLRVLFKYRHRVPDSRYTCRLPYRPCTNHRVGLWLRLEARVEKVCGLSAEDWTEMETQSANCHFGLGRLYNNMN